MKGLKIFMVLAVMFSAFTSVAQAQGKKKQMAEAKFSVYLHCDDERKKAEAVVPTIKGVKDRKASVEEQSLWIKYDPSKITKEALVEALKKKGYEVTDFEKAQNGSEHKHDGNCNHDHGKEHAHEHNHAH